MLKIGDFSKLAQVSVKTLRYYDKLGLLKPAWIDRYTGYRFYALDQLPRLNRVLAMKELGFSLEQIQDILREALPAAELRGMLKMKQAELEQQIQFEQERLNLIESRLHQLDQEGVLPKYDVLVKAVPPQEVLGLRKTLPSREGVVGLFGELQDTLQEHSLMPESAPPATAVYYDPEYYDKGIDAEIALPLSGKAFHKTGLISHRLPAVEQMACLIYQGDLSAINEAYSALVTWVEGNGYRVNGPNRDIFLQGLVPTDEAEEMNFITEVQCPVQRKPTLSAITGIHKEKSKMEPKIVKKPAFTVVGMKYFGKNEEGEIPKMWDEMSPRWKEIQHTAGKYESYGVCGAMDEDGNFPYIAGVEVSKAEDIPNGMEKINIPEQTYVVFPCTLPTIRETYEYAFQTWMSEAGYEHVPTPDFELYDKNFKAETRWEDTLFIYIPVKKK